jgi:hypothetical protein
MPRKKSHEADEPRANFDTEDVYLDAEIGGEPLRIQVERDRIDDTLRRETTRDERVQFVTRNRDIIVQNVEREIGSCRKGVTSFLVIVRHFEGLSLRPTGRR